MLIRTKTLISSMKPDTDIYNICNGLYISSGQAACIYEKLKMNEITHIVNAAPQVECCHFTDSIKYYNVSILDSSNENIGFHLKNINTFIKNAIQSGGSVLVHCHEGISRAPTICAGYLVEHKKYDNNAALDLIKSCKHNINPNKGFRAQLDTFYKDCKFSNSDLSRL